MLIQLNRITLQEKTGSPSEFANKLDISERQLYNIIDYLKKIDAPIKYQRKTETCYYTTSFDLCWYFLFK